MGASRGKSRRAQSETSASWSRSLRFVPFRVGAVLSVRPDKLTKHELLPGASAKQLKQLSVGKAKALAALASLDSTRGRAPRGWSHAQICTAGRINPDEGLRDRIAFLQNIGSISGEVIRDDQLTIDLLTLEEAGFVKLKPGTLVLQTTPHFNGGSNTRLAGGQWSLSDAGRSLCSA